MIRLSRCANAVASTGTRAIAPPLILDDLDWSKIAPGFGVVAALGVVMLVLNVRMIESYD